VLNPYLVWCSGSKIASPFNIYIYIHTHIYILLLVVQIAMENIHYTLYIGEHKSLLIQFKFINTAKELYRKSFNGQYEKCSVISRR